jgi:hypothetical protein
MTGLSKITFFSHFIAYCKVCMGGRVQICNSEGRVLKQLQAGKEAMTVGFSSYATGIYFVRYADKEKVITQRIIKM